MENRNGDPRAENTDPRSVDSEVQKDLGPGHVTRPGSDRAPKDKAPRPPVKKK